MINVYKVECQNRKRRDLVGHSDEYGKKVFKWILNYEV
jgi:hypothetical protein